MNYSAKVIESIETKPGCWNYLKIGVFLDDIKIGEYVRRYSSFYNTFCPFELNGKWYALYSADYTTTRVMTLPQCEDLCGQKPDTFGFCPVDFYVPKSEWGECKHYPFGFLAGCVWGDDWSWKVRFIDLSKIEDKILTIDQRFGYHELPAGVDLKDAITVHDEDETDIPIRFAIAKPKLYNFDGSIIDNG